MKNTIKQMREDYLKLIEEAPPSTLEQRGFDRGFLTALKEVEKCVNY